MRDFVNFSFDSQNRLISLEIYCKTRKIVGINLSKFALNYFVNPNLLPLSLRVSETNEAIANG
ncbi:MAG: hypothetical protein IJM31_06660 [Campylobacter sp.]|nr:hypothetical protein [Campylobacter sp.]MBQ7270739.1 hypothetical protein [Campylobacter sp.]MBQ9876744.1 hypothetical protein [Campylobacter sp.]MBR0071360.1 hypothetical protein [Campylobacter sp.]